jgi:UDP-glucose 4-epimerase
MMARVHDRIDGRTALVTGASGFIGAHLCKHLSEAGVIVHATSRRVQREAEWGAQHWHAADLQDESATHALLETIRPDFVFHLAGLPWGLRELRALRPTFAHNLHATVNVLAAATEVGCRRLVLCGSLEEPDPGAIETAPSSPYAASKWAANAYGRMCHVLYQTPVVIARLFMVYGPHQTDLQKLVPYVTLALLQGESPTLSSGTRPVDWIYVEDAVAGLLALAVAPHVEGKTLDIGSGRLVTVRAVVEQLSALIRSPAEPVFGGRADRPLEQVRAADVDTTFSQIGWRATTSLEDGLRRTVEWCQQLLASSSTRVRNP